MVGLELNLESARHTVRSQLIQVVGWKWKAVWVLCG